MKTHRLTPEAGREIKVITSESVRVMTALISDLSPRRKLDLHPYVEALRINAIATEASGLSHGLAGMSLALLETAALLHDEKLEDEACDLLQSCLATDGDDLSFDGGQGGILCVVRHLRHVGLLEIDYDDLLGRQERRIAAHVQRLCAATDDMKAHTEACTYALLYADRHDARLHRLLTGTFDRLFAHHAERWRSRAISTEAFADEAEEQGWHRLVHHALQFGYPAPAKHTADYRECVKNHRVKESAAEHCRIAALRHTAPDLKRPLRFTELHPSLASLETLIALYVLAPDLRKDLESRLFPLIFDPTDATPERLIPLLSRQPLCCFANGLARLLLFAVWLHLPKGKHRTALARLLL